MRFTIGRSEDCDIRIDDASISRAHVAVTRLDANTFRVEDLGSTNGTFVLGEDAAWKQIKKIDVTANKRLRLGTYETSINAIAQMKSQRAKSDARSLAKRRPRFDPKTGRLVE